MKTLVVINIACLLFVSTVGIAQNCDKPDVVYLSCNLSGELCEVSIVEDESKVQYIFNTGQGKEAFIQKEEAEQISVAELKAIKRLSIKDAKKIGLDWYKCYKKNLKDGDPLLVPYWNNIFPDIYVIIEKDDLFYKINASWLEAVE